MRRGDGKDRRVTRRVGQDAPAERRDERKRRDHTAGQPDVSGSIAIRGELERERHGRHVGGGAGDTDTHKHQVHLWNGRAGKRENIPDQQRQRPRYQDRLVSQVVGEIYKDKGFDKGNPTMLQSIKIWLDGAISAGVFRPMDTQVAAVISYGTVTTALEQCFNVENGANQQLYIDMLVDLLEHWFLRPEFL